MLRSNVVPLTRKSNRPSALRAGTLGRFLFPFLLLALITGCAPRRAHAQFIGFTAPQTNQQTLATNVACSGGTQNFLINNFGQISHLAQITAISSSIQQISLVIKGSTDGVNFVTISDTLNLNGLAFPLGTGVSGVGYYPVVEVTTTCAPSGGGRVFSLSYSGVAGAVTSGSFGTFLSSAVDKQLAAGAPASASQNFGAFTPFGNIAGQIGFQFTGGAGPAGSSLVVTCGQTQGNALFTDTFALTTTANVLQTFTVPPAPCPSYTLFYISGGASAVNYSLDYNFTNPGTAGNPAMLYAPALLGVNALTEPAAGTSALSNIVDTRGAKEATLSFVCTAGAVTLNVQEYAEDGSTTLALVSPLSAVAAATNAQITFGSESNPSSNVGTLSTAALVRLPQRAVAFSFTNAGGAGTCTARLFLAY
jgi:hypothetical protein